MESKGRGYRDAVCSLLCTGCMLQLRKDCVHAMQAEVSQTQVQSYLRPQHAAFHHMPLAETHSQTCKPLSDESPPQAYTLLILRVIAVLPLRQGLIVCVRYVCPSQNVPY